MKTISYNSSLRSTSIATTLRHARRWGAQLGITRVTDITRLDRVGIPVAVSIRPGAMTGSLCVNAGKGVNPEEALVGAWMEAIEYALAEPGNSSVPVVTARAQDVLDGKTRPEAILDLCPVIGAQIPLKATLPCVVAQEIVSQKECLLPAELVFLPSPPDSPGWFGASSGGLASGNNVLEATVHAIAELIEHDVRAFQFARDTSQLIRWETLPEPALSLVKSLLRVGSVTIRYQKNIFGIPFFSATVRDRETDSPFLYNGGFGCHPHRSVAVVRALCEAAQSRLSLIHGGRDDLTDWSKLLRGGEAKSQRRVSAEEIIGFSETPDLAPETPTIDACFELLIKKLSHAGFPSICRVVLSKGTDPLSVVRVIIPGMESFSPHLRRVGPRLNRFTENV